MNHQFTAILEQDGKWWVGRCPEIPGACAQGETKEECLENLEEVADMILDHLRDKAVANLPEGTFVEQLA